MARRGTHYPRVEGISIFRGSSPLSVSPSLIKPPLLPLPLALPFLSPFFFPRRKVNVQDGDETERERKKCEITDEYTRLKIIVISHFLSHLPQRGGLFIVKRDQNQNKKFLSLSENLFVVFVKKNFSQEANNKDRGKEEKKFERPPPKIQPLLIIRSSGIRRTRIAKIKFVSPPVCAE